MQPAKAIINCGAIVFPGHALIAIPKPDSHMSPMVGIHCQQSFKEKIYKGLYSNA